MSAIDQAFIRAYEIDEPAATSRLAAAKVLSAAPSVKPAIQPPIASIVEAAVAQPQSPIRPQALAAPAAPNASTAVAKPSEALPAETPPPKRTSESSSRRPLSTFAQSIPAVEARFKPALEVDSFLWPAIDRQLLQRCRAQFQPALSAVLAADDDGRSLLGIGASSAGAGCTTLVTCLASLLVEAGKTVAIVDANFTKPGLANRLGLSAGIGWEDVLAGNVSLAEAVVHSISDRISLLPLAAGGPGAASRLETIHASVTAGVLRYHYDVVLFDLGAMGDRLQGPIARRVIQQCRLDGVLVAADRTSLAANSQQLLRSAPELATICLGVVENQLRAA